MTATAAIPSKDKKEAAQSLAWWRRAVARDRKQVRTYLAQIRRWARNCEQRIDGNVVASERRAVHVALGAVTAYTALPYQEVAAELPAAAKELGAELRPYLEHGCQLPRELLALYQPLADLAYVLTDLLPLHERLVEEDEQKVKAVA
jgi:hypothetical protein